MEEKTPRSQLLDRIEQLSKIVATLAIPVLVAAFGWIVQSQLAAQNQSKDYVQLAANILKEAKKEGDEDLREWAIALLNANAPVKLSENAIRRLRQGEVILPGSDARPPVDREVFHSMAVVNDFLAALGFDDPDQAREHLYPGSPAAKAFDATLAELKGLGKVRRRSSPEVRALPSMGGAAAPNYVFTFTTEFERGVRKEVIQLGIPVPGMQPAIAVYTLGKK